MILLVDIELNDVTRYLTSNLGFWHELAWFLTLKLPTRYCPMHPAALRDVVHVAAAWRRGGRQAWHPYFREQGTEAGRWSCVGFGLECLFFSFTVEVVWSHNNIATFYDECFVVYQAGRA